MTYPNAYKQEPSASIAAARPYIAQPCIPYFV